MSKNNISFEKTDENFNEQELINEISKNEFFNFMKKNGYGFHEIREILDGTRVSSVEQNQFNNLLKKAKSEIKINLMDSIVFLEETFVKFKKIITILDGETKFELKKELSENFKIKLDKNSLSQILE